MAGYPAYPPNHTTTGAPPGLPGATQLPQALPVLPGMAPAAAAQQLPQGPQALPGVGPVAAGAQLPQAPQVLQPPLAPNPNPPNPSIPAQPPDGAAAPAGVPAGAPGGAPGGAAAAGPGEDTQATEALLEHAAKLRAEWLSCAKAYSEPWLEPPRAPDHRAILLEEMGWMANEIGQVRGNG
jgi:preprotein translocase subunit SecD